MDSFEDTRRQLRVALIALGFILPIGVIGLMLLEPDVDLLDSVWITITTLTTVGYGDIHAETAEGRVFTMLLILFGFGSFAFAAQAGVQFFVSPAIRDIRQRRRADRKIEHMRDHYVICGEGELVDRTVSYLLRRAELRRTHQHEALSTPVERRLKWVFGSARSGVRARIRDTIQGFIVWIEERFIQVETILDVVVVVTNDAEYADSVRDTGLLVIHDDPTDDRALRRAGISHARAVMSLLESDTETILNVLTVRSRNQRVYITASSQSDISLKMIQVGANIVMAPYDVAGQFLNNATLRPVVNDFFNSIVFDQRASTQVVQLFMWDDSPWIGKTLGELDLYNQYDAGVIGILQESGQFNYMPTDEYQLQENEVVLAVTPGSRSDAMVRSSRLDNAHNPLATNWQRLPSQHVIQTSETTYSLMESEQAIAEMSRHFIICGTGPILQNALDKLNPERPFVVVTPDNTLASEMIQRGFRVVMGNPSDDEILIKAGIDRALAIMISIEDKADSVLTVLNSRTQNKGLLIVTTASTDDMIPKLRRAGADRVVSPFRIAAQFVLLATTSPVVSDFIQYVLFNYQVGLETTELYMQDDSPWIGKSIGELYLRNVFSAGVVGVRQKSGRFVYAPQDDYVLGENEVMIVITPMSHADELRRMAHGEQRIRPHTLRTDEVNRSLSGIHRLG